MHYPQVATEPSNNVAFLAVRSRKSSWEKYRGKVPEKDVGETLRAGEIK